MSNAESAPRYAVRIHATDAEHNDITRYLCRYKRDLFVPHEDLTTLRQGGNPATYETPARARAAYLRFYRNRGKSLGLSAMFEVFVA